jgi:hypothetical protein
MESSRFHKSGNTPPVSNSQEHGGMALLRYRVRAYRCQELQRQHSKFIPITVQPKSSDGFMRPLFGLGADRINSGKAPPLTHSVAIHASRISKHA